MSESCIIITRPLEDAISTAERLAERGFASFVEPMLAVEFFQAGVEVLKKDILQYDGIIITSKNALRIVSGINKNIKIIVLGAATTALAIECGFTNVEYAGANINELCEFVKAKYAGKTFCYASGESVTQVLGVQNCGNFITRVVVYKTIASQNFSEEFVVRLKNGNFKGVMFFSTKTAATFARILEHDALQTYAKQVTAICLSVNIAKSIKGCGFGATVFTKNANIDEIISLVERICFE
jgi:uroporphyrinogen-III synthase